MNEYKTHAQFFVENPDAQVGDEHRSRHLSVSRHSHMVCSPRISRAGTARGDASAGHLPLCTEWRDTGRMCGIVAIRRPL